MANILKKSTGSNWKELNGKERGKAHGI
jgi:hypothetical protein